MGDGEHGLAFHQAVEALLDRGLDLRVQRACGLVEDQDRRVLQQDTGNGNALALSAGQLDATFPHMGVIAPVALQILQIGDETMGFRFLRCGDDLFPRGIGTAIGNVLRDRAMQQGRVLRDHADGGPQAVLLHGGNVLPVDQDATAFQVMEPEQQIDQRGLARA